MSSDDILICPLCHATLNQPQTLQTCLHTFCLGCITRVEKTTEDGVRGWKCSMCDSFTALYDIKHNEILQSVIEKNKQMSSVSQEYVCEQCVQTEEHFAECRCMDCKMNLCIPCQIQHLTIPFLKSHRVCSLPHEVNLQIVDYMVYCSEHDDRPLELNCVQCEKAICFYCKITEHDEHKTETIEHSLSRMVPLLREKAIRIKYENQIMEVQLQSLESTLGQAQAQYESAQKLLQDKCSAISSLSSSQIAKSSIKVPDLEKDMESLNPPKDKDSLSFNTSVSPRQADIDIENTSKIIEVLKEMDSTAIMTLIVAMTDLKNRMNQGKNLINLVNVYTTRAKSIALLTEIQDGLLKIVDKFASIDNMNVDFEIPEVLVYTPGLDCDSLIMDRRLGIAYINSCPSVMNKYGLVWTADQYMCNDFTQLEKFEWKKTFEKDIEAKWGDKITLIANMIWIPMSQVSLNNRIWLFDLTGKADVKMAYQHSIHVVKKLDDGVLLTAGKQGLFHSNLPHDYSLKNLTLIKKGLYFDLCISRDLLLTMEIRTCTIYIFQRSKDPNEKWAEIRDIKFQITDGINSSSTICMSNEGYVLVSSHSCKCIYQYTIYGQKIHTYNLTWPPCITGLDRVGNVIITDHQEGTLHRLNWPTESGIIQGNIAQCNFNVNFPGNVISLVDSDHNLWSLQFKEEYEWKLVKYTKKKPLSDFP